MTDSRRAVTVEVAFDVSDLSAPLADVIASLEIAMQEIPPEYRESASLEISAYDEWGDPAPSAEIKYTRPETDQELRERLWREEEIRKGELWRKRQAYERLKAEFEPD